MKHKPNSQTSLVLWKLITVKTPITVGNFTGYPRISEYVRRLRKDHNLDIQTIPIKFTTQFGAKSQYASYKLKSPLKDSLTVLEKLINSK